MEAARFRSLVNCEQLLVLLNERGPHLDQGAELINEDEADKKVEDAALARLNHPASVLNAPIANQF